MVYIYLDTCIQAFTWIIIALASLFTAVTEKVAQVSVEESEAGRSNRTFVKDKSAQLEAKLERENQKKKASCDFKILRQNENWFLLLCVPRWLTQVSLDFSGACEACRKNKTEMYYDRTWFRSFRQVPARGRITHLRRRLTRNK